MTKPEQRATPATLWLDVSLLLECDHKKPTGIPRTTLELFRAWRRNPSVNLRLCRLDFKRQIYTEATPEQVLTSPPPGPPKKLLIPVEADLEQPHLIARVIGAVRAIYQIVPIEVRRIIGPNAIAGYIKELLRWFGVLAPDPQSSIGGKGSKQLSPPLALGPADIVVSLGGGWNHPGSEVTCRQLREQLSFRSVHLIYDLIPVKFPQLFREDFAPVFDGWLCESLQAADLTLAISEHTRRDVLEYCARRQLPIPPIEVVRLGELISPESDTDSPPNVEGFDPTRPFVLSVGTLEIRKNHLLLYYAWQRLVDRHGDRVPQLVLVGASGWLTEEVLYQINHDPRTRDHIILLQVCDDPQLRWLYRYCLFTMYPSHYEGWGLPVAESLALGKYCIASNTSSIPEIAGDLIGLHDPSDLPSCLRLIHQALDPDFRAAQEERIRRAYRRTSWDETGEQVLCHIEKHLGRVTRPTELARSA